MTKMLEARPRDAKIVAGVTNPTIVHHRMREPPPLSCRGDNARAARHASWGSRALVRAAP